MKDDGGPAFPNEMLPGMSLRDYFAAKAMQSELVENNTVENEKIAQWAYAMADAMLGERKKWPD